MEKYGFVYIWYDRKHKRYYIGMHWGTEDDGYICSSPWMKQAHKHRPNDFKRKILERIYTNRKDLYEREKYWLSMINESELKKRYYNASKNTNDTWLNEDSLLSRKEKISVKTKEAMQRPEVREKYFEGLKARRKVGDDPEVRRKKSESMKKTMALKFPDRYVPSEANSIEHREKLSEASKKMHLERSPERSAEIYKKISEAQKKNRRKDVTCPHCNLTGHPIAMKRWHFDKCKTINIENKATS